VFEIIEKEAHMDGYLRTCIK